MNEKRACRRQKLKGNCYASEIEALNQEIETVKNNLKVLEEKIGGLRTAVQSNYLTEVLKVEGRYLDGYSLMPILETKPPVAFKQKLVQKSCTLSPETCEGLFWYKTHMKEGLRSRLQEKIATYNEFISLCLQLQHLNTKTSQSNYNQCFLQLIEDEENKIEIYSNISEFIKGLPENNHGKIYLLTSKNKTKEVPLNTLEFMYEKGSLKVLHFCIMSHMTGIESLLIQALEAYAHMISPLLMAKRYLPITTLEGELGVERYTLRSILLKAYVKNHFQSEGKNYPDGTYLPHQKFIKNI